MTIEEVKELIKIDETRVVEFKKTTGELKDAMHSVCAMLNSDGGYVIIDIAPKSLNELVNPGTFPPQLTEESIRSNHESYPYNSQLTLSDFSHCRKVRTILQPLVTLYLPNRTHTCKPVECFF